MATTAAAAPRKPKLSLAPTTFDRLLAVGALLLFALVLAALWRGRGEWSEVPTFVWAHLATILAALALTPVMMFRRRGDRLHRRLGWVWCSAMFLTAALSFCIRGINQGGLSFIHILSGFTLVQVPLIAWSARTHRLAQHRAIVRAMVAGALIIAGIFTLPPSRMLGEWLLGCRPRGSEASLRCSVALPASTARLEEHISNAWLSSTLGRSSRSSRTRRNTTLPAPPPERRSATARAARGSAPPKGWASAMPMRRTAAAFRSLKSC